MSIKSFVLVLSLLAAINSFGQIASMCGGETVQWGLRGSCGAQLWANGDGLPVGYTQIAMDPDNGGEATYVCTEAGWTFQSGTCAVDELEVRSQK